jgi:hypothetical protein
LAKGVQSRFRFQSELAFKQDPAKERTQVDARAHLSFAYNRFVFSALESFSVSSPSIVDSKLSAAAVHRDVNGYAQVDLSHFTPSLLTLGVGYRPHRKVSLYAQAVQSLVKADKAESLAAPSASFGVDYAHCSGFGVKAAVDLKGKLQTNFNFTANKYFSGSLLFDVSWDNSRPPLL